MVEARARTVLLVGPDGTGKSTTAELLSMSPTADVRTTGHYRPGILWKRSPIPTVTPHAEPGRNTPAATVKLMAVFFDFVLGYLGPWRRLGRRGVVVLERGWWDHVADPVRYRLPPRLQWLVEVLARVLPRADLVVVLSGDAVAIVARKPELDEVEVNAQLERWSELAPRAGLRVLTLDTVQSTQDEVVSAIERTLQEMSGESSRAWIKVPATPKRNGIVTTTGANGWAALGIYRPNSSRARLLTPLRRVAVRFGLGRRSQVDPAVLDRLPGLAELDGTCGMAVMASPGRDRRVVGLAVGHRLKAVAKVGPLDDEGLRHEADVLSADVLSAGVLSAGVLSADVLSADVLSKLDDSDPVTRAPGLRFAGEVADHFVVITDAVGHVGPPVERDEIDPVLTGLARIGLVHGDLAPWNLVRQFDGRLTVLDLEHAWWGAEPGFDLCHFLVQTGALLGSGSPKTVLDDLRRSQEADVEEIVRRYAEIRRQRGDATAAEQRFIDDLVRSTPAARQTNEFQDTPDRLTDESGDDSRTDSRTDSADQSPDQPPDQSQDESRGG